MNSIAKQNRRLTIAALLVLIALALAAPWIPGHETQTAEQERADMTTIFSQKEEALIDAEQRHDWKYIDGELMSNFEGIRPDGRLYTKQDVAVVFPEVQLLSYKLSDMKVEAVAINVILVTCSGDFDMRIRGQGGPMHARLSTIWVRDSNYQYKARFHQVVPIPPEAPAQKPR